MIKKSVTIFGGTGGLGRQLAELMRYKYSVAIVGSKGCDIRFRDKCEEIFIENDTDVVINLSGVNFDKFVHKLDHKDTYRINHLLDVNLHGTVNIVSSALPHLRDKGWGRVILISSVLATTTVPGTALYSSCKAFIDKFAKSVAAENSSKGVTVNSIQLGYFDGGLTNQLPNPEQTKEKLPLKRWGKISELYNAVEFLIENDYVTGINLPITGGL